MKRIIIILSLFLLSGCASVKVPGYIRDENPYKKKFYANFDDTLKITVRTLRDFGWDVEKTTNPSVFERSQVPDVKEKQVLLFTNIRSTSMFLGSRYARLNVYIRSISNNISEVEIRCITLNSVVLKSFTSYKKDAAVERMFKHIEEQLNK